jgi:hypothetical protein
MKKILFLSVMIMLLGGGLLFAQNTIDVSGLKVEAGTVTFKVEWSDAGASNLWSDTVWVFVDYNKNGKMTRMLLEPGSTLTATSSPGVGKLVEENIKGAWVVGDARTSAAGSFSATVQLLTATADLYGACAYASSYPPVATYVSETKFALTGTPIYEITLTHTNGSTITVESGGTFFLPCSYTMSSFTDATGAPGIISCPKPTSLSLLASSFAAPVCAGTTVTLTASAGGAASYSINGTDWYTSNVFEVAPVSNASYTLYVKTAAGCSASVIDEAAVAVYPAFSPGTIATASTTTNTSTNPNVTIDNSMPATGGDGNITYEWRRSGTSGAVYTGTTATYTIGTDDYSAPGTYHFNRYAHDSACSTTWVAAAGTYTLYVAGPPGAVSTSLCTQCCYDGDNAAWVDCYVTVNAYPFNSTSTDTQVLWSGTHDTYYEGARSPYDGRANTDNISSPTGAVGICKALGTDWYLPAYEELVNMSSRSSSESNAPPNGRNGAGLLVTSGNYWSSTEMYNNGGRYSSNDETYKEFAVLVNNTGVWSGTFKYTAAGYVHCAWRP